MADGGITAKQALAQFIRRGLFLERKIADMEQNGKRPWQERLELEAISFAIPLIEARRQYNVAHHEGGTTPTENMRI